MRPLRVLVSLSTGVVAVTLLIYLVIKSPQDETTEASSDRVTALFSFTSPGSLFPPSAIISLTDDNSTFFLARPAAFGPDLPKSGLSGPLWIGSGFGEEAISHGGELGCSDVPGWDDSDDKLTEEQAAQVSSPGTSPHADIQSLQESAEIAGKVVLLKRGGCGFLAKVQWAQRRGGKAVIVGDDVRGGALVRMYAKGDTSNISIPSLFTSHTTAHLLSSLVPSEDTLSKQDKTHLDGPYTQMETANDPDLDRGTLPRSSMGTDAEAHTGISHFFLSLLGFYGADARKTKAGSHRLPNSGALEWTDRESWGDDQAPIHSISLPSVTTPPVTPDKFVIGQHDWRDSDLLHQSTSLQSSINSAPSAPTMLPLSQDFPPKGAEYTRPDPDVDRTSDTYVLKTTSRKPIAHDGLWVTLTPTNVSSSPFFDTLLVLVVSPLVTLTVVYVLLLLRSRIRRRRWRAPKSVVERLPVRTYQTMSESTSSAASNGSSPTTPLLQRSPVETTSNLPPAETSALAGSPSSAPQNTREREEEKRESGLAAWRRRYGGRQKECVVCLEEYVDGVSQVMSLPCGHEFHEGCITPWLVTRRRTCPICKGDVVRSLSQSYHDRLLSPSPTRTARHFSSEDVQAQAAETRNESPSASRPVPVSRSVPVNFAPLNDPENAWPDFESEDIPASSRASAESGISSSLRNLSSTVATTIWRGFDAVRNSTSLPRRAASLEDIDRDR